MKENWDTYHERSGGGPGRGLWRWHDTSPIGSATASPPQTAQPGPRHYLPHNSNQDVPRTSSSLSTHNLIFSSIFCALMEGPVAPSQSAEQTPNPTTGTPLPSAPVVAQSQPQTRSAETHDSLKSSVEDLWYLKEIWFPGGENGQMRPYKIITQNFNG